jgi:hypothetical protein
MKTMKSLFLFFAGLCLIVACNKDDQVTMTGDGLRSQNNAFICGKVFKVHATNGTDITADLKQAFDDAKAAGPGSVVQLPKGNFELGFIEIREFYGSFIGAGQGRTIITANTGLATSDLSGIGELPVLIKFVGGDITIRDMTIQTPQGYCGIDDDLYGLLLFSDYNVQYESKNSCIKGLVDNVEFITHLGGYWGWYNCYYGILATHDNINGSKFSNIDMTVTNCTFNTLEVAINMTLIKKGRLIAGARGAGNIFTNCYEGASFWCNIDNVEISITGNTFNIPAWSYGSDVDNGWPLYSALELQTKAPLVNIESNIYNKTGGEMTAEYTAIWIHDYQNAIHPEANLPMFISIRNNLLNLDQTAVGMTLISTKNLVVSNNKFTGNGYYGIYACGTLGIDYKSEKGRIIGNNFSKAVFSMSAVYLSVNTKDWIVAGNYGGSVENDGINNVIIGMNMVSAVAKQSVLKSASIGSLNPGPSRRKGLTPGSY